MTLLEKFLLCIGVFVSYILYSSNNQVFASSFIHDFNFVYEITENGNAHVYLNVITTNKTNFDYISSIELELPFRINNIDVSKSKNPIQIRRFSGDSNLNLYTLTIDFLNPIIGNEKFFEWNLSFTIENVLIDHGIQKVIILPKVILDNVFIKSSVFIKIPNKLGDIQFVYGGEILKSEDKEKTVIFYTSNNSSESQLGRNLIVLLSNMALYSFNINLASDFQKAILPLSTSFQKIFYNNNSNWKDLNVSFYQNTLFLDKSSIANDINLNGHIVAYKGLDAVYDSNKYNKFNCNISDIEDISLINFIKDLSNTNNIYDKAFRAYLYLSRYKIVDYTNIYSGDFKDALVGKKSELNVYELNSLYRYILCLLDIESRFVMGYVFPIQPLKRFENKTYQHTWVEFWNGQNWISVDPSWYISSKGDIYFGKNNFHHITFSYFYDLYDPIIEIFRKQKDFLTVEAINDLNNYNLDFMNNNNYKTNINLTLQDEGQIQKKIKVTVTNMTQKILILNNVNINCEICINKSKYQNVILKPFSEIYLLFDIGNLGFILSSKELNIYLELYFYEDINKTAFFTKSDQLKIFIKPNFNLHLIFLSNILISIILLFKIATNFLSNDFLKL